MLLLSSKSRCTTVNPVRRGGSDCDPLPKRGRPTFGCEAPSQKRAPRAEGTIVRARLAGSAEQQQAASRSRLTRYRPEERHCEGKKKGNEARAVAASRAFSVVRAGCRSSRGRSKEAFSSLLRTSHARRRQPRLHFLSF